MGDMARAMNDPTCQGGKWPVGYMVVFPLDLSPNICKVKNAMHKDFPRKRREESAPSSTVRNIFL